MSNLGLRTASTSTNSVACDDTAAVPIGDTIVVDLGIDAAAYLIDMSSDELASERERRRRQRKNPTANKSSNPTRPPTTPPIKAALSIVDGICIVIGNEEVVVGGVDRTGITDDDDASVDSDDDNGDKNEKIADSVVVVVEEEVEEDVIDEVNDDEEEKEVGVGLKVVDVVDVGEGVADGVKGVGSGVGSGVGNGGGVGVGRAVGAGVGTGVNGRTVDGVGVGNGVGVGVGNGVGDFVVGAVGGAVVLIGIFVCCMQKGLSGENGKHWQLLGASKQSRQLRSRVLGFCNTLQGRAIPIVSYTSARTHTKTLPSVNRHTKRRNSANEMVVVDLPAIKIALISSTDANRVHHTHRLDNKFNPRLKIFGRVPLIWFVSNFLQTKNKSMQRTIGRSTNAQHSQHREMSELCRKSATQLIRMQISDQRDIC